MAFIFKNIISLFTKPQSQQMLELESESDANTHEDGFVHIHFSALNDLYKNGISKTNEELLACIELASNESMMYLLKLVAFLLHSGLDSDAHRILGRKILIWLQKNAESQLIHNMKSFCCVYGQWDDCFHFPADSMAYNHLLVLLAGQLNADLQSGDSAISDVAKWIPSEKSNVNKKTRIYYNLAKKMGINEQMLRKTYLAPLRSRLNILETQMCNNMWSEIEYSKLSPALLFKYRKPFLKHDRIRFLGFQLTNRFDEEEKEEKEEEEKKEENTSLLFELEEPFYELIQCVEFVCEGM